ncbi:protein HIDE1 [Numenius arquata]|uniref:protein HIDE1 n=1 Tax=Numenius arquata TaxID=31919 RepID=UPI003D30537B
MKLEFLLLVAGAVAAPRLSPPPPLGLLFLEDRGPPKISCIAPRSYAGSTFELFAVGADVPTQRVSAEPGQHRGEFTLDETPLASRCYRCRYRSYNGSAWEVSGFSMEIMVNASSDADCHPPPAATGHPLPTSTTLRQDGSWLLPVAVSAGGLVLLLLAAAAVGVWQAEARRQRAKRQPASCWTERRFPITELSYDNCAFAVGVNVPPGASGVPGTSPVSRQRDPRASSPPAAPSFSTFRSLA